MTGGDSDSDEVVNSASAGSDVENVDLEDWGSEVSGEEIPVFEDPVPDMVGVRFTPAIRVALEWLDTVNLCDEFTRRAAAMKSVPHFLKGPYRNVMRLAMEEATHAVPDRSERGWRLFLLLPRLLSHRPPRRGNIHKNKLAQRFDDFAAGKWMQLLHASRKCDEEASVAMHRKRRRDTQSNEMERRAARALSLVQMGELSSGRQALEGASLAPGSEQTLNSLRDPERRPPRPRDPIPRDILEHQPAIPFELAEFQFVVNLRTSRRGAAADHRA